MSCHSSFGNEVSRTCGQRRGLPSPGTGHHSQTAGSTSGNFPLLGIQICQEIEHVFDSIRLRRSADGSWLTFMALLAEDGLVCLATKRLHADGLRDFDWDGLVVTRSQLRVWNPCYVARRGAF